jgi:hypothetical protein
MECVFVMRTGKDKFITPAEKVAVGSFKKKLPLLHDNKIDSFTTTHSQVLLFLRMNKSIPVTMDRTQEIS